MSKNITDVYDLYENIAAISAEVWGKNNGAFYTRHGEFLSGFPGVWRFCIDAAKVFTEAEDSFKRTYGTKPNASYEYLDAILPFAEWIADAKKLPTVEQMKQEADRLILAASTVKGKKHGR